MTPTPLAGASSQGCPLAEPEPEPRVRGGRRAEAVTLSRVGGNTHPRNPKGATASPHSLPLHQIQTPRRVQSQRGSRIGSDRAGEGLRQMGRINAPLQVPAPASRLHWRRATHHVTPGVHLAPSHDGITPHPWDSAPAPFKAGGSAVCTFKRSCKFGPEVPQVDGSRDSASGPSHHVLGGHHNFRVLSLPWLRVFPASGRGTERGQENPGTAGLKLERVGSARRAVTSD